jgi:predicted deacylase
MSVHDHPIEFEQPDISAWRQGNTGVDYVWSFDSGRAGPHVMVQALTHGNEWCGAVAVDALLRSGVRPRQGRLTLAFANVEAFARFDPDDPNRSRYIDEDYNRVWADDSLLGARDSAELRRARQLRPFVDAADLLLDIHSMHEPSKPLMVCGVPGQGGEKSIALSQRLRVPEHLLVDTGHPAGLRMIERGGFGDPRSPRTAILIECGQHWARSSVSVAFDTTSRFLVDTGALAQTELPAQMTALDPSPSQYLIRVTEPVVARSMNFRFAGDFKGLEVIPKAGDPIAFDGDEVVRAPYDQTVLVMPSLKHLKVGTTMVRLGRLEELN